MNQELISDQGKLVRAELDMQITTAKAYPRNPDDFIQLATQLATQDEETAQSCFYCLTRKSRDGQVSEIKGASIRLAEIAAASWGNLHAASRIVENDGRVTIRLRDAPNYCGMDRHRFNDEVRPYLTVIPIGEIGIAFDRLDLDAWLDDYKQCKGRPPLKGRPLWEERKCQDSLNVGTSGTLTRKSTGVAFQKALDQALSKKLNAI